MHLNPYSGDKGAFEAVRVNEKSHRLHSHCIAAPASHCENRSVLNNVCAAVRIRNVDLQARVIDLDEGRQADLIVTLLRLKESESVVYRRQRGDDLDVVGHFGHLVID